MKKLLILCVFLVLAIAASAQQEANNWYFGYRAGLNFSTNPPQVLQNGRTYSHGGHASISDAGGNLLFYIGGLQTSTDSVWNRQHKPMPNGFGYSVSGGANSAMIIPWPGQSQKYFLFTSNIVRNVDFQITYSVVDMALNGGMGDVTSVKNVVLLDSTDDQIGAVRHRNNRDIWLIGRKYNSNRYYAYLVSPAGISTTPVITTAGLVSQKCPSCTFKASPDGKLLASVIFTYSGVATPNRIQLLNFDAASGVITNAGILPDSAAEGLEFSPDGSKLYSTRRTPIFFSAKRYSELMQYDLTGGSPAAIFNNRISIFRLPYNSTSRPILGYMQVGPDGKIYMTGGSSGRYLNVIGQPNARGLACNFTPDAIDFGTNAALAGDKVGLSLPAFIQSFFYKPKIELQQTCFGDTAFFQLANQTNIDSVHWNFGDPASGLNNTSTGFSPKHYYGRPGPYTVQTIVFYTFTSDTLRQQVFIPGALTRPILGRDTILCQGDSLVLNAFQAGATYRWSDNLGTDSALTVTRTGLYWVELDNGCHTSRDSIRVTFTTPFTLDLGVDKVLCQGETLVLSAARPQASYRWQDGSTGSSFTVSQPGLYWVEVQNVCTTMRDSIRIAFKPGPVFSLGPDTVLCPGEELILKLNTIADAYAWQDGSTGTSFRVRTPGTYWARLELDGCFYQDSIIVRYQNCLSRLTIPNIITPNNDGKNDFFVIPGVLEGQLEIAIFNRWGVKVFEDIAYRNNWQAEQLSNGTYYYLIRHPESGSVYKGWLEVLR